MATYAEIEDLRDKWIDNTAALLKDIVDDLNGEEPADIMQAAEKCANDAHGCLQMMIMYLDELLIQKKRAE